MLIPQNLVGIVGIQINITDCLLLLDELALLKEPEEAIVSIGIIREEAEIAQVG